ncbi:MAG TPA: class I SAM-dependent methyltransferase [Solirubrobacteraceae bacterium]
MTCPACGGTLAPWRTVSGSEPGLVHVRYELRRCTVCGTSVTITPEGASGPGVSGGAGDPHESGAYRAGTPRGYRAALPLLRAFDRRRLALLRRIAVPPARVLDAGAGQGRFVAAARAAGYDAFGIEPAQRGLQRAAALSVPVLPVTIEAAEIPAGSLDAVTLWHVLEHVTDPGVALERIAGWLVPGGGLLVGVPNLASLQAQVGGERWYHLDVPRHRTHFTPAGLTRLLERSGLAPVAVHHLLLEHNPYGMWQSAVNRLTRDPSYVYNVLKRNAPPVSRDLAVSALALPLAPLAAAAELAAGASRRGGTIAVLARRAARP